MFRLVAIVAAVAIALTSCAVDESEAPARRKELTSQRTKTSTAASNLAETLATELGAASYRVDGAWIPDDSYTARRHLFFETTAYLTFPQQASKPYALAVQSALRKQGVDADLVSETTGLIQGFGSFNGFEFEYWESNNEVYREIQINLRGGKLAVPSSLIAEYGDSEESLVEPTEVTCPSECGIRHVTRTGPSEEVRELSEVGISAARELIPLVAEELGGKSRYAYATVMRCASKADHSAVGVLARFDHVPSLIDAAQGANALERISAPLGYRSVEGFSEDFVRKDDAQALFSADTWFEDRPRQRGGHASDNRGNLLGYSVIVNSRCVSMNEKDHRKAVAAYGIVPVDLK